MTSLTNNWFNTVEYIESIWLKLCLSVQLLSYVWLFATPWTAAHQASLSITNSWSSLKPMFIESMMPSNHLILCHPLLRLPSIFPSIRVFSNESALCIRGENIGVSALTSVFPMNTQDWSPFGWTGWISLQSKGLSRVFSTPQFKIINSSALSFLYSPTLTSIMTTGKTIALTRWTFVGKVMSLFFNMLSRLVITFLPRSKCLLISWLQSPSAVILKPQKIKSATVSTVSPSICHEVMGPDSFSECWALSQLFHSPLSLSSRGSLLLLHFLP